MPSPLAGPARRRATAVAGVLALLAVTTGPVAATGEPFVAPIPPRQMEVGDRLDLSFVVCLNGAEPTQTGAEAQAEAAVWKAVEDALNIAADAVDPQGRSGPRSYDPVGFDEAGNPIWAMPTDPRDNPYRIRLDTAPPPGCVRIPPDWRYSSDVISLEPTSNYGQAEITAIDEGTATLRVRSRIADLPTDWVKYKIKVTKPAKLSPFEKLYGDAFKVDHVEIVPHETRASTDETVMGMVLECNRKNRCRPAAAKVGFEHDEDGDIVVDSVTVSGPFFKLTTGATSAFDIGRAFTKAGRQLMSLSIEKDARQTRARGDANGINGGIDPADALWLWLRRGMTSDDEGWDAWMDIIPDGTYDMWDLAAANAVSVQNGNGSFDPGNLGYDPTVPGELETDQTAPGADDQPDTVTQEGSQDPVDVIAEIPAWKLLAMEDDRITRESLGESGFFGEESTEE